MASWSEVLKQVKSEIREISPESVQQQRENGAQPVVVDVREKDEWEQGHLHDALFIPRGFLEMRIEKAVPDRDTPLIVYCQGGVRSAMAVRSLQQLGYTNLLSMAGGFAAWKQAGLPFKVEAGQDNRMARYTRHLRIPEVGEAGQKELLSSSILLIGAGGLGSPAALYLAAAGVGRLGIVDSDLVDETNLQRQILHKTRNIGIPKVQSARETLWDINPNVKVEGHNLRLNTDNAEAIIAQYDVVVDGCDNFRTRYLVNDICVKLGKPNVYGSIFRFDGQSTVFVPGQGPCYRCLYPEPSPAELAPSCEEAGVLGVLPGTVGLIQATEAIKLILNIGEPLVGRLLHYDALEARFRQFKVPRNPQCKACGEGADIDRLIREELPTDSCPVLARH